MTVSSAPTDGLVGRAVRASRAGMPFGPELIVLGVGLLGYWLLPSDLGLLTNMAIMALLALSLSFVLGQAGIASIGHAALFGAGAYAAGLFAKFVIGDPLLGLLAGGAAGFVVATLSGFVVLRVRGLTLVMLTIATAQILLELANWARGITGGDDGLSGFEIAPLFGVFTFDFIGKTGYLYALGTLVLGYFALRKLAESPFGLTARAIRLDAGRVEALGGHVYRHLVTAYAIGGFVAGVAGALTVQTTKVASLSMLDFQLSASALIMVVLGGTNRLAGALIGTVVYMSIQHVAANLSPHHWLLVIGILLVATMVALPGGLIQLIDIARSAMSKRAPPPATKRPHSS